MEKAYRSLIFIIAIIAINCPVNAASSNEEILEKRTRILDEIKNLKEKRKENYIESKKLFQERSSISESYLSDLKSWNDFLWDKGCKDYDIDQSTLESAINEIKHGTASNDKKESSYLSIAKYILKLEYKKSDLDLFYKNYGLNSLNKYDNECISSEVKQLLESNVRGFFKDCDLKKPKSPDYSYYDSESKILRDQDAEINQKLDKLYDKLDAISEELDKPTRQKRGSVTIGSDGTTYRTFDIER
jgi:hypothetical protein